MVKKNISQKRRSWNTTVFLKQAMAVSGLFFVVFILFHSYGNLKIFGGPEAYNEYAHHLRTMFMPILPYEGLLWILRVGLIVFLAVHLYAAAVTWKRSKRARGSRYMMKRNAADAYAARTMRWGGVILLIFIIFHLLHFTTKTIQVGDPNAYAAGEIDGVSQAPYLMMQTTFAHWYMVLVYAIGVAALCMHISHGIWSALQSFGWLRKNTKAVVVIISGLVGLLVFVVFMAPPTYLLFTGGVH
ncbi:succinate dehydrogenase cytochrome b subunit [Boudabousia marimammalium]|uniref:Succinate dehydrogenase n=1 Tax=Boudabousia marimammalium TaxID=156892 RepID=A0A1Q5PJK0_9ACTO|nr:succinate dehydrogenase cytochrome b subunit [Boudabousia marimammalium]OKL46056.1 succinate dehydrogenase [Boudabousia marimammalium]